MNNYFSEKRENKPLALRDILIGMSSTDFS